jgi:hypothetical protein
MTRIAAARLLAALVAIASVAAVPRGEAREKHDLLRLKSGQEISIQPGWEASYEKGSFWFEYVRPRRLACTLPLQDVAEIVAADGTIYQNTYEPPRVTFSNQIILDVFGTIVQHGPLYPWPSRDDLNTRGWNSRTGRYEPP